MSHFVDMPLNKLRWSPSPLPSQIVLVTTIDENGQVDVAPKSCTAVVAFGGPTFGFGCNRDHQTLRNIEATGEFVVNVPGQDLAALIWPMAGQEAAQRLEAAGLETEAGQTVGVPHLSACPAHLECRLDRVLDFEGGEVFVLGTVTRVAVDERCSPQAAPGVEQRYAALGTPIFYLEGSYYAPVGAPRTLGS